MALNTKHVYSNKLYAHLTASISASATTLSFYPGEITSLLAGWQAGSWLYLCIMDLTGSREIIKMTGLSGATLTVERGQGGTTAKTWAAGSLVSSRVTAEYLDRFLQKGVNRSGAYNPNTVLTGDYTGEKYYQTGPDAAQRRWWMNTTGDKWRLLTGEPYGVEAYGAVGSGYEGYLIDLTERYTIVPNEDLLVEYFVPWAGGAMVGDLYAEVDEGLASADDPDTRIAPTELLAVVLFGLQNTNLGAGSYTFALSLRARTPSGVGGAELEIDLGTSLAAFSDPGIFLITTTDDGDWHTYTPAPQDPGSVALTADELNDLTACIYYSHATASDAVWITSVDITLTEV